MKKHLGKISDYRGLKDTRLIALLHTSNEQQEFEIKIIITFTTISKKKKYLCEYLTKYVQDLYTKCTKF